MKRKASPDLLVKLTNLPGAESDVLVFPQAGFANFMPGNVVLFLLEKDGTYLNLETEKVYHNGETLEGLTHLVTSKGAKMVCKKASEVEGSDVVWGFVQFSRDSYLPVSVLTRSSRNAHERERRTYRG